MRKQEAIEYVIMSPRDSRGDIPVLRAVCVDLFARGLLAFDLTNGQYCVRSDDDAPRLRSLLRGAH